jgi:hypothetical protein
MTQWQHDLIRDMLRRLERVENHVYNQANSNGTRREKSSPKDYILFAVGFVALAWLWDEELGKSLMPLLKVILL